LKDAYQDMVGKPALLPQEYTKLIFELNQLDKSTINDEDFDDFS